MYAGFGDPGVRVWGAVSNRAKEKVLRGVGGMCLWRVLHLTFYKNLQGTVCGL